MTTTTTQRTFRITSRSTGADFGCFDAASELDALATMHRDAGYDVTMDETGTELVWDDADDAALCGGLDVWRVQEVPAGVHHIDPGSMGAGWDDDTAAARDLASVLRTAYERLGWPVTVDVGYGRNDADSEISRVADVAFEAFCGESGDVEATVEALESRGTIPA